jgi:hypothetical protein
MRVLPDLQRDAISKQQSKSRIPERHKLLKILTASKLSAAGLAHLGVCRKPDHSLES